MTIMELYGQLIEGVKMILHCFRSWSVTHIKIRDANMTTHRLAKKAIQQS
jgi:hypothetical protein